MTNATILERPKRQKLREKVLAISSRILAEEGLAALQARRVATEAGCSVGSIYNLYEDLDGLILAANETTLDLLSEPLSAAFEKAKSAPVVERLIGLALAYMQFALAHRVRWRAVFEHRLAPYKELPEHYAAKRAKLLALIERAIEPEISDQLSRHRAARALFGAVHGIITLALDNKLAPFDATEVEREITFIVIAAAKGLATSG